MDRSDKTYFIVFFCGWLMFYFENNYPWNFVRNPLGAVVPMTPHPLLLCCYFPWRMLHHLLAHWQLFLFSLLVTNMSLLEGVFCWTSK